jgi:hypothetical protein
MVVGTQSGLRFAALGFGGVYRDGFGGGGFRRRFVLGTPEP